MSVIIKGMSLPKHAAVNGDKDTVYRCAILAHADHSVELVVDASFASAYDNGHNIQRYPITEIPTPHGRLIDADVLKEKIESIYGGALWTFDFFALIDDEEIVPTIIEAEVSE